MAAIDLSTAGVKVYYAKGLTDGQFPSTGFTKINGIKSIPDFNVEPETIESTTLEATRFKTYVEGLRDLGGSLAFGANLTEQLMTDWDAVMEAWATQSAANKEMWWVIVVPGLSKSLAFAGKPAELGMPSMEVSAILETQLYITPMNEPSWVTKPTITE